MPLPRKPVLKRFGQGLLDLFLPEFCLYCERRVQSARPVPLCSNHDRPLRRIPEPRCHQCQRPLNPQPGSRRLASAALMCGDCRQRRLVLDRVRCGFLYDDVARDLIVDWKYHGRVRWGTWLGDKLKRVVQATLERFDLSAIVPVPLHPSRRRDRGFNQARQLATGLADDSLPLRNWLEKVHRTRPQSELSRTEREKNLKNSFETTSQCPPGENADTVVIVDDVFTTGSTLRECARTLRAEGFQSILGVTLMRAVPDDWEG